MKKKQAKAVEQISINMTPGTDEAIFIGDIKIPQQYYNSPPNKYKVVRYLKYYIKHGYFDKAITVIPETNEKGKHNKFLLVDEYARYVAAKWLKLEKVPVKYIDINDYIIND
jgi:hypothetical protein